MKVKILKTLAGPALGALGTIVLMVYPTGHAAFCSGVSVFV